MDARQQIGIVLPEFDSTGSQRSDLDLPLRLDWANGIVLCNVLDSTGSPASGKSGRVGVTTEMEIDVMKGLVLAQHQRIERQRSRMQELERDLR